MTIWVKKSTRVLGGAVQSWYKLWYSCTYTTQRKRDKLMPSIHEPLIPLTSPQ